MRIALVLFLVSLSCIGADTPDDYNRVYPWRYAGTIGGIPTNRTQYTNLASMGGDPTGATDASALLASAISSCPANQYVYIPAGRWLINSWIITGTKSNVTIKGAGATSTVLVITNSGYLRLGPGDADNTNSAVTIASGATKDSTNVLLNSVAGIAAGEQIRFLIPGAEIPCNVGSGNYYLGQNVYVTSLTGSNVTFTPPLTWDYTTPGSRVMPMSAPGYGFGLEDFSIESATNLGATGTLMIENAVNNYVRRVNFTNAPGRQIFLSKSSHIEIRECFFSNNRTPAPGGGDGIVFAYANSGVLIEDNIFYKSEPGVKFGDGLTYSTPGNSGNVVAYNFFAESNNDGFIHWPVFSLNHGYHNWLNLVEGNVVNGVVQDDGYHGSSSHAMIFRNFVRGYSAPSVGFKMAISLCRYSRTNTVIGNILGDENVTWDYTRTDNGYSYSVSPIWRLGYPNMGNTGYTGTNPPTATAEAFDTYVTDTIFRHSNFDFATNTVVNAGGYSTNLAASYFRASKPSWFGGVPWPPIGPDVSGRTNRIPAQYRYSGEEVPSEGEGGSTNSTGRMNATLLRVGNIILR